MRVEARGAGRERNQNESCASSESKEHAGRKASGVPGLTRDLAAISLRGGVPAVTFLVIDPETVIER
jgi:hypothetical protein